MIRSKIGLPRREYKYNRWDESLGCEPFDDPKFLAAHARYYNLYCLDCDADILAAGEYYKVFEKVWDAATKKKAPRSSRHTGPQFQSQSMLCIGCLEARIQRQLGPGDFYDCEVNNGFDAKKSQKLLARLGRTREASGDCQPAPSQASHEEARDDRAA